MSVDGYITWSKSDEEAGEINGAIQAMGHAISECKTNEDFNFCYVRRSRLYFTRGNARLGDNENGIADMKKAADYGNKDALEFLKECNINYTPQRPSSSGGSGGWQKKVCDNGVYEGIFVNGKLNGKGKITFNMGDVYEGDCANGMPHGIGKYTWKDGVVYEGGWANNLQHGNGKYIYPDGRVNTGRWANGKPV
ncbi:MAG: hypothetical protein FWB95_07470 [Treponema sp.]|nr:hypothetical protein [Treponema sp.]